MRSGAYALLALLGLLGCGPEPLYPVAVDVRSDLLPGREVGALRTRAGEDERVAEIEAGDDLRSGFRAAELALPAGDHTLEVAALNEAGTVVASRPLLLRVEPGGVVTTVLLTRDCRDVVCADEGATACVAGRCAAPECTVETPEACPDPECTADGDCPAFAGACAAVACVEGACVAVEGAGCGASEFCEPESGCRVGARFGPPEALTTLLEGGRVEGISLTGDQLEVFFASDRAGGLGARDVWTSARADPADGWPAPTLVAELSSEGNEAAPTVLEDGLTMYLTVGSNIHRATRPSRSEPWTAPVPEDALSSGAADFSPTANAADTRLVMTREGNLREARRASVDEPWPRPEAVTELNTPAVEGSPSLTADGLTLVFSREHEGGGRRLFRASRASLDDPFGPGVELTELAEGENNLNPWVSPDARTICWERRTAEGWTTLCATR